MTTDYLNLKNFFNMEINQMSTFMPFEVNNQILCYYTNPSKQIQIIRITNIPNFDFEKIVFPKECLMFEAVSEARLKIYTGMMNISILVEEIPCHILSVQE